ncbi:shikimate dehydrogenase [Curtobacterium sp. 18060]|uniref:shikimate dehydrogenase n=1 Tax=Curtobacterium sp. 18060 TaxID=2681408 RepID=UPI00135AD196|nr:shikimate dehydrogenase [Curtobacterium sp. 18060]
MPHTLVGLIGAGLQRSLTPLMHEAEGRLLGLDYEYRLLDLDVVGRTAADLPELLATAEAEGYRAVNVTHPCKQAVVPLLDALDPRAARIGAVNLVLFRDGRRIGYNTDETGFRIAVERGLGSVAGQHVVQFGAGGAGSAIAHALVGLGARRLDVVDADVGRAEALVATLEPPIDSPVDARVLEMTDAAEVLATADGAVNATPLGMNDDPRQAFDPALLPRGAWVSDAVYFPLETPLVRSARAAGCRVVDGGWMAVGQAVASLRHITGLEPDLDRVRAAFTGFLVEGRTAGDRTGREAVE